MGITGAHLPRSLVNSWATQSGGRLRDPSLQGVSATQAEEACVSRCCPRLQQERDSGQASNADRLAPARPTPRGCILPGRAGGDAPCPPGSGARAGVPATAQRVLQNTGSHVSLLSHRLKNEETLLDGKQGKKKRKKARMMCSWTTAPSQFMLGAKSTHRSLPIE